MKVDFNKLKTEISLPDFLIEHYGFTPDKGSSKLYPKLKSPNGQVLVIKRNQNGIYTYFDIHDDRIKGKTILDFMQQEVADKTGKYPSLREVGEILQGYINSGQTILPEKSVFMVCREIINQDEIFSILTGLKPLKDTSFLVSRGIDENVLKQKEWDGVFFENSFLNKEDGTAYKNTCVKLFNTKGVEGISQRNHFFKGALGNRYDCVAASIFNKEKPIDNLYIGESMIDCISHYQMYHKKGSNDLYISSEGQITEGQITTINDVLTHYKVNCICPIFDNDKAGASYRLKLLGGLQGEGDFSFSVNAVAKESNVYVQFRVHTDNPEEGEKILKETFKEEIIANYVEGGYLKQGGGASKECSISFPYIKELLVELTEDIGKIKLKGQYRNHIPEMGDFNEDLQKNKLQNKEKKENKNDIQLTI